MNLLGLIVISLALGLLAWLGFLWSVRSGQYEDPEGPKYRMLDDDEDGERPGGPTPRAGAAPEGSHDDAGPADAPRDPPSGQTPGGP